MTVICYTDPTTGMRLYEEYPGSVEVSIQAFRTAKPGIEPDYQFQTEKSMVNEDCPSKRAFMLYCRRYGFTEADYNAELILPDNTRGFLKGFETSRRKYVFRIWSCAKQDYILVTPNYLRNAINRAAEKASERVS